MKDTALYFDLDGCLVDSRDAIEYAIGFALHTESLPKPPRAELVSLIGPPLQVIFTLILERLGKIVERERVDSLVNAYREVYAKRAVEMTVVVPGVREILRSLRDAGGKLAVCTSKPQSVSEALLAGLSLRDCFESVTGPIVDRQAESKVATLRRARVNLPVAVGTMAGFSFEAMIGDRMHDVAAGRANGMTTIGVTWGSGTFEELLMAGADEIVDRVNALEPALSRLKLRAQTETKP